MGSILYITYPLNALLILALVTGLGLFLTRKFRLGWRLWWIGAATFILSQVFHIPFNILLSSLINQGILPLPLMPAQEALALAVIFGLSAGIFESTARYLTYRYWAKDARSWGRGLLLGAGHGGIEAIFIALYVIYVFIQMAALRNADLESMVSPGQVALAEQQVDAYWSNPWYLTLLGAVERLFTLPVHLALSVMVLQVFTRGQIRWLFLAILWHAVIDGLSAVYIARTWGVLWSLPFLGVLALISAAVIFALRRPEPEEEKSEAPPPPPASKFNLQPAEETADNLEKSRYE